MKKQQRQHVIEKLEMQQELNRMKRALADIRQVCRDGQLLKDVKLLEIYHEATLALDRRDYLLDDMRSGRQDMPAEET